MMDIKVRQILTQATQILALDEEQLLIDGVAVLLEQRLLQVNAQILEITSRYNVSSVEEMDQRYQDGTLSEIGSWKDFQRLDHLEYDRDQLHQLLDRTRSLRQAETEVVAAP
ncbi:MAG: hypothetical protein KF893_22770 [Caldilineaceae bacterium]|nr:hypothetical protein [Caldilineaceae bacterium]